MISEWVMTPGDWRLRLKDDTPQDVLDSFDAWDHVIITDQWVEPARYSDTALKNLSRYSGVLLELPRHGEGHEIAGLGLAVHLGDADNVGDIYESAVTNTAETFPNWIRDLLPPGGSITEGTLSSASGTLTATVRWVTPRQAIDWVCGQFSQPGSAADCEWRVNPNGTLDAGTQDDLYIVDPAAEAAPPLLVARETGGQPNAKVVPVADLDGQNEAYRRLLKQWVHGQGEGDTLITGSATVASALKDFHGNALVRTAVESDPQVSDANIDQRAGFLLRSHNHTHLRWTADLDDFWVQGQFQLGDWVLVYDQQAGFTDTANEVDFRSDRIYPEAVRVVGMEWAATDGMGVYLRTRAGVWTDLSQYVEWERPATRLHLGDRPEETLNTDLAGTFQAFVFTTDDAVPNLPTSLAATADTYINARGQERAWIIPTWTNPTQNTDGSTLADLDVIQLRFRRNSTAEEWEYRDLPSASSGAAAVRRLDPDTVYELQAQARRRNSNVSGWTSSATVDTSHDTTAPGTAPTPTVTALPSGRIKVAIPLGTGSPGWGVSNPDVSFFRMYCGTATAPTTEVAQIPVTSRQLAGGETIYHTYQIPADDLGLTVYVRLKAVDDGGNSSAAYSTEATVVAVFPNDYYGLPGAADNLCPNPSFESGPDNHPCVFTGTGSASAAIVSDATYPRCGAYAIRYDPGTTGRLYIWPRGSGSTVRRWPQVFEGQQVYFGFFVRKEGAGTPDNVVASVRFIDAAGSTLATTSSAQYTPTTSYALVEITATAPADTVAAVFFADKKADGNSETLWFDDFYARIITTAIPEGSTTARAEARLAPEVAWWIDREYNVGNDALDADTDTELEELTFDPPAWVNYCLVIFSFHASRNAAPAATKLQDAWVENDATGLLDMSDTGAYVGTAEPDGYVTNALIKTGSDVITCTGGASFGVHLWGYSEDAVTMNWFFGVTVIGYA